VFLQHHRIGPAELHSLRGDLEGEAGRAQDALAKRERGQYRHREKADLRQ